MGRLTSNNPGSILSQFCRIWARQDLAGALDFIHDDIVYSMFIPQDVVPFGGETRGKPSMADRMRMIRSQFETVRFKDTIIRDDDSSALAQVAYAFRHRATGETVEGQMRLIAQVADGLIIDLEEYHDLEKVRAFMRLIAHVAADQTENDC